MGALALTLFLGGTWQVLSAQQDDEKTKEPAESKKIDYLAVPVKGDAKAFVQFLEQLSEYNPDINSEEEYYAVMTKVNKARLEAGTKGLAQNPSEDEIPTLLRARVIGLISLFNLGERDDPKEALKSIESFLDHDSPKVAGFAKAFLMNAKMALIGVLTDAERQELIKDVMEPAKKEGLTRLNVGTVNELGESLQKSAPVEEAAAYYRDFAELAKKSKNEQIADYGVKLEGIARRLSLPGNKMEVFGKTVAGDKFDWDSYRGKVVLVDFWATWCGPCLQELPNVKANYAKFKDRGFDVVGVNLDQDKERLNQFVEAQDIPWVNIFPEKESERGWEHPLANHYGISGIPATILVDREGKVVSLSARGPELGELLEKLLGESK